jgi:hypothetical protein
VSGVRGEKGEGGIERKEDLKGVGEIRRGLRVLVSDMVQKLIYVSRSESSERASNCDSWQSPPLRLSRRSRSECCKETRDGDEKIIETRETLFLLPFKTYLFYRRAQGQVLSHHDRCYTRSPLWGYSGEALVVSWTKMCSVTTFVLAISSCAIVSLLCPALCSICVSQQAREAVWNMSNTGSLCLGGFLGVFSKVWGISKYVLVVL